MVEGSVRSSVRQLGGHVGGVVVVDVAHADVEEFLLDENAVHQTANIALAICLYIWPVLAQRTAIIFD